MKRKYNITEVSIITAILGALILVPQIALAARDLADAASTAVSTATTIAKVISTLGVVAGAIAYQIPGASHFAKGTMVSGLIGMALSFGGTSILNLARTVFGA
ncbi:MAG: hypothetical protein AABZ06_12880 [Bdellovibrionota bacterium]